MPELTVLSYNLWLHKAFAELPELVQEHGVDVLCLQECKIADVAQTIGNLSLVQADLLNDEIGLAIYVDSKRWMTGDTSMHSLPNTPYEKIAHKTDRTRLQLLKLTSRDDRKEVVAANTHIANLLSGNRGRRQQAATAAHHALKFADGAPLVMAGDFNYPFGEKGLLRAMHRVGLTAVGTEDGLSVSTYHRWPKKVFDRMFTVGFETTAFVVLPFGASDHAPILGRLEVAAS